MAQKEKFDLIFSGEWMIHTENLMWNVPRIIEAVSLAQKCARGDKQ